MFCGSRVKQQQPGDEEQRQHGTTVAASETCRRSVFARRSVRR